MLQLKNATPFAAKLMLLPDADGIDTLYGVVKATFKIGPRLTVAEEQTPVIMADQHYGEPPTSSIRASSDVCLGKPGTDVVMVGSAWSPDGRPVWQSDVSLSVGPLRKTVRVFGDRVWETGAAGSAMVWVAPFVRMPITWERAFGGTDVTEKGPSAEPRNPVGTGYHASGSGKDMVGMPLPNVEDPRALLTSPRESPSPAGFAPIAPHWEPRKRFAGTYDESWQQTRAPYLPADFDTRFFHFAPEGLVSPRHLEGGEAVEVVGATPEGILRLQLPAMRIWLEFRLTSSRERRRAVLDTVILEPDEERLILVWRATLRCDKQALKIREVGIDCESV